MKAAEQQIQALRAHAERIANSSAPENVIATQRVIVAICDELLEHRAAAPKVIDLAESYIELRDNDFITDDTDDAEQVLRAVKNAIGAA